jgi:RadC-like JAB domain
VRFLKINSKNEIIKYDFFLELKKNNCFPLCSLKYNHLLIRSVKGCYVITSQTSSPLTALFAKISSPSNKEGSCSSMEKLYEILQIKQVISEVREGENHIIRSPIDGAKIAAEFIGDEDREVFLVMCLNTKNRVVAVHRCHVGALNSSLVHPREVFKAAILNNSASIIVSHQHRRRDMFLFY